MQNYLNIILPFSSKSNKGFFANRLNSADEQGQISHIPSIPLPRNDNDIILGIGNLHSECNIVTRKPPPGGVGHHQGRLNSRINHRDFSTTRNRSHERSNSRERPDYSNVRNFMFNGTRYFLA